MNDLEARQEARVGGVGGGIELGYASTTTSFVTTSTSVTDVTGLAVTVVVAARPILVKFRAASINATGAFGASFYLNEDGTNIGSIAGVVGPSSGTGDDPGDIFVPAGGERRLAPAAGSHTYKVRAKANVAGTLTMVAGDGVGTDNSPAFIQVVEI